MTGKKAARDSNIELLRIVLMLMIIMHHLISRGCGLSQMADADTFAASSSTHIQLLINSFLVCAVNAYVFISGYFGIKFDIKKFLSFITQALFYSLLLYLIMSSLGFADLSLKEFVKSLFPITRGIWWFFSCFLGLYILSPLLNKGLSMLNRGQIILMLILLFYLGYIRFFPPNFIAGNGFSIYSFVFIYILAYFFRRFDIKVKKPLLLYLISSLLIFLLAYFLFMKGKISASWGMFAYNNPLVLSAAIGMFFTFKRLNIQKNYINIISSFTFGVYLFHEVGYVNVQLANVVKYMQRVIEDQTLFFLSLLLLAIIVFIVGMAFDKARQVLCNPLTDRIMNSKLIQKTVAYLDLKN